jgi:hypothetical protein
MIALLLNDGNSIAGSAAGIRILDGAHPDRL